MQMKRSLTLEDLHRQTEVAICIFAPSPTGGGWSCRWEIAWPDRTRTNEAHGADSVQATILALQSVGTELYNSAEHKSGKLFWIPGRKGYGFPVPHNVRDLLEGDDKISF